jgi:hypothetical protein
MLLPLSKRQPGVWTVLHRPRGRKQNSPWALAPERRPRENRPERAAKCPGFIPKDNVRRKRFDGVSGAHEALPDTKICGDAQPDRKCRW